MRYGFYSLLLVALLLAGCQAELIQATLAPTLDTSSSDPTEAHTPTPVGLESETTAEAVLEAATEDPLVAAGLTLPLPGTIQAPATEDPDADVMFDSILFYQTGGPNNIPLTVEVYNDGRVVRDGVTRSISQAEVLQLHQMLKDMNFFGINGQFTMPGRSEDVYYYQVTVERDGGAASLSAQDGYTPPVLLELFAVLSEIGT